MAHRANKATTYLASNASMSLSRPQDLLATRTWALPYGSS